MKELWYCSGRKQATSGKILTDFLIRNDSLPLNYTWKSKIKGSRKFHVLYSCVHAMLLQSCRTLCHPMYYSPPASPLQGILQARIPEWVALPSSRGSSWPKGPRMSLTSPALADEFFSTSNHLDSYETNLLPMNSYSPGPLSSPALGNDSSAF